MGDHIRKIDPAAPDPTIIAEAVRIVRRGGMICFPTRCLYGLGVDAFSREAVERVYAIKKRSKDKPLSILIRRRRDLETLAAPLSITCAGLIDRFWPGRLTLVCKAAETVPEWLTAGSGRIGVRLPGHPVAVELMKALPHPLTATSANLSDADGCARIQDIDPAIIDEVDLVLDAGELEGGQGSTIVDASVMPPSILREGAISAAAIFSALSG